MNKNLLDYLEYQPLLNIGLTPEQVTVVAHRLIVDNKADIEAFRTPVGDGSGVQTAMNDSAFTSKIQFQVYVVQIEEFLSIHLDWLERNGVRLSDRERYEVAKQAAANWSSWADDEAKEQGLLAIAQVVEQENSDD